MPEEECKYVDKKDCQKVPEEKCHYKTVKKCHKVPEKKCKDVPKKECHKVQFYEATKKKNKECQKEVKSYKMEYKTKKVRRAQNVLQLCSVITVVEFHSEAGEV